MKKSSLIFGIFLTLFLAGCSLRTETPQSLLVLLKNEKNAHATLAKNENKNEKILKLSTLKTPPLLSSKNIIYFEGLFVKKYAHHSWAMLPENFYQSILTEKLENAGLFKAVIGDGERLAADYELGGRLDDFELIFEEEARVKIRLNLFLKDLKNNEIIKHKIFDISQKIEDKNDLENILAAFNCALNIILDEIVGWVVPADHLPASHP